MRNNLLLKNRDFRIITLSDVVSTFGDSIFDIAIISYFSSLDNSAFYISIISFFASIPSILSYYTGVLVDKTENKPLGDIISNIVRSLIFILISGIFFIENKVIVLIIYVLLKFISDLLSEYSNSLTFPIIASIFSNEDMEQSITISSIFYNLAEVSAKALGGVLLIFFAQKYHIISIVNSVTFMIAVFLSILIYSSLREKITIKQQKSITKAKNKPNVIQDLFFSEDQFFRILRFVVLLNFVTAPLLSTLYIFINSFSYGSQMINFYITILSIISVAGAIAGNFINSISFFRLRSLEELFKPLILIIFVLLVGMMMKLHVYLIFFFFICYTLISGPLSLKFSSFILTQQDFNEIGSTVGLLNSIITIGGTISLFISMVVINYFSLSVSLFVLISAVILMFFISLRKG